jgi:peptidoglycan/LPS O-acetylase OafA/YrhL
LFFLPAGAWRSFAWQIIGALTFTANHVSQAQIGGNHDLQPLSHFWSLSLEEQFYFIFPLFLWITPKRFRAPATAMVAAESVILGLVFGNSYYLTSRTWELLAGSLAYFARSLPVPRAAKWAALVLIPVLALVGFAPLAVIATAIMLIGKGDWVRQPAIERIGDWSYSIYLVHWPLISLAAVHWSYSPVAISCAIALSFGLAALQYRYVEQPFRKRGLAGHRRAPAVTQVKEA